jgi:hypothetical protein
MALTMTETLVQGFLSRCANDDTALVWASLDTIASSCRIGRTTAQRAMAGLCKKGAIVMAKKGGGHHTDTYRVLLGVVGEPTRQVAPTCLKDVDSSSRQVAESSRQVNQYVQTGRSDPLYKVDTPKETKARRRAPNGTQSVAAVKGEIENWLLAGPRDLDALSPLAREVVNDVGAKAISRITTFDLGARITSVRDKRVTLDRAKSKVAS